ncbi:hypothetical protein A1O3_05488 [Capronia epimyces CBS 606.96]|uniref:NmrA-like domain-containing protein n=1 Tax=Capronia epimyces CBS 606.96 TaxID=1182542 RepID=W9Y597_9EURO|nr:uncharacterized protein A1O3_05488 [Capronia epimyces CBS 606.96]EXJ84815.1 hypothetical protein A1O3_05488 [Capronia epimyces CBS 606.96]
MKTILFIGATGAQGGAAVKYLAATGEYRILALTRNKTSSHAQDLAATANVEVLVSEAASGYGTEAFLSAASRSDYVFVNTDGFTLGEQAETFWGIRLFELAVRAGVKHFIYSGLDYASKAAGYDPKFYVGHYEGKARVEEWIHAQQDSSMAWTIIRSGPYMELLSALMAPAQGTDGTALFALPLGDGAIPFIHLGDFGKYVHWSLSHPDQSNHRDFGIATAHVSGNEIEAAFSAYTGKPAKYVDLDINHWNVEAWKHLPKGKDTKIGYQNVKDDNALLMTYGENFTNWWNLYKASKDNKGLIQRDYDFLDQIVPDRVKSLAEWMEKVKYTGEKGSLLRLHDPFKN